ncbi:ankyrin repeat and BTB/POZ domain-containing protein 2-like protein, partial [Aphelenchoides avenae]
GLTALAQAVLTRNQDAMDLLIALGVDVSFPVPQHVTSDGSQRSEEPALLSADFAGWTPLTWAVALQDHTTMTKIIEAAADVDEPYMTRETPLQICSLVGNVAIAERLRSCGADSFASTVSYDSLKCNFRSIGTPSPLALAAANGHYELFQRLLKQVGTTSKQGQKEMSLGDFLKENGGSAANLSLSSSSHGSTIFDALPKTQQRALLEAIYYAVETSRLPIVKELRKFGVPWNGYTWACGLEVAVACKQRADAHQFLSDFNMRFADDFNGDVVEILVAALFEIVRNESHLADGDCSTVANIVARLHHRFTHNSRSSTFDSASKTSDSSVTTVSLVSGHARPIIDPRYVDNPELSDIRFKVGEKVVYAHRIVLANASEEFRRLLDKPNGQVSIEDVSYEVFKLLMEYMYGNTVSCLERLNKEGLSRQLEVLDAAKTYGLSQLESDCEKLARAQISHSTVVRVYHLAK